jgi:hypothetical protein
MKRESADNQNGSTESTWPGVLRITGEQFQQSFAVAQLAVTLWENKMAKLTASPPEKEKVRTDGPNEFLKEAWQLIESAHKVVLRPQTDVEYLTSQGGSSEATERVFGRRLRESYVPFKKLCDPERNKGDSETIYGVIWKVFTSERGFDDLFWTYWRETSILKIRMIVSPGAPGDAPDKWEGYGKQMLASWKRDGVPPSDFLTLARFRKERDNRAENLKKELETEA